MGKIINVEIGQSLPKERWQEAARNLTDLGKVLARNLLALVYVSGTGGVQGKFLCPGYVKTNLLAGLQRRACIPMGDLVDYAGGPGKSVCAWIVENPVKFDEPRPLAEFGLKHPPMSWQYIEIPETEE